MQPSHIMGKDVNAKRVASAFEVCDIAHKTRFPQAFSRFVHRCKGTRLPLLALEHLDFAVDHQRIGKQETNLVQVGHDYGLHSPRNGQRNIRARNAPVQPTICTFIIPSTCVSLDASGLVRTWLISKRIGVRKHLTPIRQPDGKWRVTQINTTHIRLLAWATTLLKSVVGADGKNRDMFTTSRSGHSPDSPNRSY